MKTIVITAILSAVGTTVALGTLYAIIAKALNEQAERI